MPVNRQLLAKALSNSNNLSLPDSAVSNYATGQDISDFAMDSRNFGSGQAGVAGLAAQLSTAGIGAYTKYKAQKDYAEREMLQQEQFSKQFPHLADIAGQLSPQTREAYTTEYLKSQLKESTPQSIYGKISADYNAGLIDQQTYRSALKKESSFAPDSTSGGGATGAIVRNLMAENSKLSYAQALSLAQGLARQGFNFDNSGMVSPFEGLPQSKSDVKRAEKEGEFIGKKTAEVQDSLNSQMSKLPELKNAVMELSDIGKDATYTKAGQLRDSTLRQLNLPASTGAIRRKEYISKVDNQILPLLRDTFGAQFTEREGETLRKTLGDANASPAEKDAVLKSFIKQKVASIKSTKRELDYYKNNNFSQQDAIAEARRRGLIK